MWLMLWVKKTNATVLDVSCAEPEETKGIMLKDFPEKHTKCVSTGNYDPCTVQRFTKLQFNRNICRLAHSVIQVQFKIFRFSLRSFRSFTFASTIRTSFRQSEAADVLRFSISLYIQ